MAVYNYPGEQMSAEPERQINLLLVNETRLMGNVIAAVLEDEPGIHVLACVTNIEDALKIVQEREVDVALVSTRLPDHGALKLTSSITELMPASFILRAVVGPTPSMSSISNSTMFLDSVNPDCNQLFKYITRGLLEGEGDLEKSEKKVRVSPDDLSVTFSSLLLPLPQPSSLLPTWPLPSLHFHRQS